MKQFAFLTLLSTLPLAVAIAALGQPRDILIIFAAAFSALGIAVWWLPLGLLTPLLFGLAYLTQISAFHVAFGQLAARTPPPIRLASGLFTGILLLGLTVYIVTECWRRIWIGLGNVILWAGVAWSLSTAALLATRDKPSAVASAMFALLVLLGIMLDKESHRKMELISVGIAGVIGLVGCFALFTGMTLSTTSVVAVLLVLLIMGLKASGTVGFIAMTFTRIISNALWSAIAGAVVAGLLVSVMVPIGGVTLGLLITNSFSLLLFISWLIGFGAASLDPSTLIVAFPWVAALAFHHHWPARWCSAFVLLGYFRVIPGYPFTAMISAIRAVRLKHVQPMTPVRWLQDLPPHTSELLWLPLPGYVRIFLAAFRAAPSATLETLSQVDDKWHSPLLRRTKLEVLLGVMEAFRALDGRTRIRLVTDQLRAVQNLDQLVAVADRRHRILMLFAPELYLSNTINIMSKIVPLDADTIGRLRNYQSIAKNVEPEPNDAAFQREQRLERALSELTRCESELQSIGLADESRSQWQSVLEQWRGVLQSELEKEQPIAEKDVIIQPFQSGNPLLPDRADLFKGRKQLANDLVNLVTSPSRPAVVLHGPRRCGKSSFLLNLSRLLPDGILPVYLDLQSQAMTSSEADFCFGLVRAMVRDLRSQGLVVAKVDRAAFQTSPYPALEDWLDEALPLVQSRRILLCLDEFERLGMAIEKGTLTFSVFDELRHLIQHRAELSFILCGVQTLEELGPNWTSYFINTRPMEMLYLKPDEAEDLLRHPHPAFNLKYEPTIVDQVLDVTRCQPYLLQLIGEAMVNEAQRNETRHVTQPLLDAALTSALVTGEIYFMNLWEETTGSNPEEIAAGQALLQSVALGHPVTLSDNVSAGALARLKRYHLIMEGNRYEVEIPLVARWLRERSGAIGQHGALHAPGRAPNSR